METLQKRASQREFSEREISEATLSQVLWAACGINRPESKKITAPSAINAQDILMYVARKDGAYLYEPQSNTLKKICNDDLRDAVAANQKFAATAPVCLIMVTDLSPRMYCPRSEHRSPRRHGQGCHLEGPRSYRNADSPAQQSNRVAEVKVHEIHL